MIDPRLQEYIKRERTTGRTEEEIKSTLLNNGWKETDMAEIFGTVNVTIRPSVAPQPAQINRLPNNTLQNKKQHRSPKVFVFLIILITLIIIGGAGLFFASPFLNLSWNFFRPTPETVILKAWNNLKITNSESFNSELLLSGNILNDDKESKSFDFTLKSIGESDIANELSLIKMSVSGYIIDNKAPLKYDFSLSGEERLIKKDIYFKLTDINIGELENSLMMFGIAGIEEIEEKWIKIETVNQSNTGQDFKDATDKIVKILLDRKAYDITELEDNSGVEGKEYHYRISLNREKLINASPEIYSVLKDYFSKYSNLQNDVSLEDFQKFINNILDKTGEVSIDLFIGKKDNFFHKILFEKNLDMSKFSDKYSDDSIIKIGYKIESTNINNPVQVSAPDEYENWEDILLSFKIKSNIISLYSTAEQICSKNKSCYSFCRNGLLNGYQSTYGKSLININNTIISQGGTRPICFSNIKNYCISTQLKDGSWLCVSKNGQLGNTKCLSAETVCQ